MYTAFVAKANLPRRHQKQALTFMRGREKGWDLFGRDEDIWKVDTLSRNGLGCPGCQAYTSTAG